MIETERLILSPPTIDDFECSLAMHRHETMARYTGGQLLGREDVWRKLLQGIGHWTTYGYGIFVVRGKADCAFIGEVGLAGELRPVPNVERRLQEAARLGYKRAIVPRGEINPVDGMQVRQVATLGEALAAVQP